MSVSRNLVHATLLTLYAVKSLRHYISIIQRWGRMLLLLSPFTNKAAVFVTRPTL